METGRIVSASAFNVEAMMERMALRHRQEELFDVVRKGGPKKWNAIREIYRIQLEDCEGYSPYFVDWPSIFTPIENGAWQYIRSYGLTPMYPQFPIGPYFVDFADPTRHIVIECDGAKWHDPKKDAIRDAQLLDWGWQVFRFTGKELWKAEDADGSARDQFRYIAESYYNRVVWRTQEELEAECAY